MYEYYLVVNPSVLVVCDEKFEQSSFGFDELWKLKDEVDFFDLGQVIAL